MTKILVTDHQAGTETIMPIEQSPFQIPIGWAGSYHKPGVVTIKRVETVYRHVHEKEHHAVIVGSGTLHWPEPMSDEDLVQVDFIGGRNGKGVFMTRCEFELFYEEVE